MARPSNADKLAKIHADAVAEFDAIQKTVRSERMQALEDRRFYSIAGAQWEGSVGEQFENKPRFEFNECHLAVIRIFSEYRNNRITVDFTPKDGDEDDMADVCDGLYRADEKASSADEAYDNAFEEGVGGGFGAWRLRACREDEEDDENEHQRITIEPIYDADTCVFFDLDAKRQDKRDAKRCWVLIAYTPDAYKEEYGDDPSTWERQINRTEFDWCTNDVVWVAEHYRVEEVPEVTRYFQGLDGEEMGIPADQLEDDARLLDELLATGFTEVRQKTVKRSRVHKYLMSGSKILKDCGLIAGRHIPIVPFFGKRWMVDGVERFMGHVRLAKDAQRLNNALMSWLADMAMRFDIEKPIFSPEQIVGHTQMWADDNIKRFPHLLANMLKDAEGNPIPGSAAPQAYTRAPNIPPAMAALTQLAQQGLTNLLGNQQAGEELQPNISGKAVELIQNRLDMQTFIYLSNLAKSMKRSGEIWLSMMKDIAVEDERKMKTVGADGKIGSAVINKPAYDPKTAEQYVENDFSGASYDVDVSVGPSSQSLRNSVVRALTGIASITDDPQTRQALTLATIANLEGEGLGDLREWARGRALRMGLVKPNDQEKEELAAEMQNTPPDPQTEYLRKAAMAEEAKAKEANAKTIETIASADLKRAQTAKTVAETEGANVNTIVSAADAMRAAAQPPQGAQMP